MEIILHDELLDRPIIVKVESDYDGGPYTSIVARLSDGTVIWDMTVPTLSALDELVAALESTRKNFTEPLDTPEEKQ